MRPARARFLHTSIFVNDMRESIAFYTEQLGLELLGGPHHYPGNADMAFIGASWDAYIELVYDLEDHKPYDFGTRVEHLALEVNDLDGLLASLCASGASVMSGPKADPEGMRRIAFIVDPNGIPVELLEKRA